MPRELHDLIRRAYRSRRTRVKIIIEDCLERLPHYRGLSDSLLDDVRESVDHHLVLLYRVTLETGRALTTEDLRYSRQLARRRAAQGVPLGAFLTFFLVGLTRAWEHLIANAGDDPSLRAQILDRVTAVISNQTQLMTALTEAYVEERERLSRFQEQDRDDFVQLLLAEEAEHSVLEARAQALGMALDEPRTVAIFGPSTPLGSEGTSFGPDDLRRRLAARLPGAEIWVGRSREGFVALLSVAPEPKVLAATAEGLLRDDGRVGVGSPGCDVAGIRRSAREALRAHRIGMSIGGSERVHTYDQVAVLDLVGIDSGGAEAFVQAVLGPIAAPGASPVYLETLRQLSASNYRVKLAAAELSVHPHTMSYRMKQIRRRFGLDLDDPDVRLRIQLALLILDARGTARPS